MLTLLKGSMSSYVVQWQKILRIPATGYFDADTDRATREWQKAHGLYPDGIVGPKTWRAAGLGGVDADDPSLVHDARAKACVAALRDANRAFPGRSKASDGILGDASHMARVSDHNTGNAVDITHDPLSGCDGEKISRLAITDFRVTYVIYNREIYNRLRANEGWRKYTGSNPHTHHVHISVSALLRDDDSQWPWAKCDELA